MMKIIKIEQAGNVMVNDLNIRNRTVLKSRNGDIYYIEFNAGYSYQGRKETTHFRINHLFRVNNKRERENSNSQDLYLRITLPIHKEKIPYTESSLRYLLDKLEIEYDDIVFSGLGGEYQAFSKNYGKFILGNEQGEEV